VTRRARKVLDVIKAADRPLFWHEAGVIAYPRSTRWRYNILGKPFLDLVGSGLSATFEAIRELERDGLVTKGADHRYSKVTGSNADSAGRRGADRSPPHREAERRAGRAK